MQHPPALDLDQLARYHAWERQCMPDRFLTQQDVTQQNRRVQVRYHASPRSSSRYGSGSRAVKGCSFR